MSNYQKMLILVLSLLVMGASAFGATIISTVLANANATLGNATAIATSNAAAIGNGVVIAETIAKASALLGNALAISKTDIISVGNAMTIVRNISKASSLLGNAYAMVIADVTNINSTVLATTIADAISQLGNASSIATNYVKTL